MRRLAYRTDKSYATYRSYLESSAEAAANAVICLIHQANYLLDQQLRQLDQAFRQEGGLTEKLRRARTQARKVTPRAD